MSEENLQNQNENPPEKENPKSSPIVESIRSEFGGKDLHSALLESQMILDAITKDATNDYAKYDYVSAENIVQKSRDAFHKTGLVLTRFNIRFNAKVVKMTFVLTHPKSGDRIIDNMSWPIVEGKQKPMDKALASALTSSMSYWLRDILAIPRVEKGDEMDNPDTECQNYDGSTVAKARLKAIFEKIKLGKNEWKEMEIYCRSKPFAGMEKLIEQKFNEDFGA